MQTTYSRVARLQAYLKQESLDAAFVFDSDNRRYLSGFRGSTGYVVVTQKNALFFTDFRYTQQAGEQCPGLEIVSIRSEADVISYLASHTLRRLGLVEAETSVRLYKALKTGIEHLETAAIDSELLRLRMVKDAQECASIRKACEITDLAFSAMCEMIRPGMTEAEVDRFLQDYMRGFLEVERMAERFIVASGPRGSMPHGLASGRTICDHEFVTVDFGCNCGGYWSDVTRTVCVGEPDAKQREIYETVLAAQNAAILLAAPGKTGRELDHAARTLIADAGYGEYFGHNLGHSFGLNIHEAPQCARNQNGDIPLQPGMIVTIEPGIYIPQFGGVRIEDDILITENGCENLTRADKQLIIL